MVEKGGILGLALGKLPCKMGLMDKIAPKQKLTAKQERFCYFYTLPGQETFGNGTKSYIEAYGLDATKKSDVSVAKASSSRLLTNVNLIDRINSALNEKLNDREVDAKLAQWIFQNENPNASILAIKEYNKLRQRITEKIESTNKTIMIGVVRDVYREAERRIRENRVVRSS